MGRIEETERRGRGRETSQFADNIKVARKKKRTHNRNRKTSNMNWTPFVEWVLK